MANPEIENYVVGDPRSLTPDERRRAPLKEELPPSGEDAVEGELRPNYYRVRCWATLANGQRAEVVVECFDMIHALKLGFWEGNILKYLWRTGRKTVERRPDLRKVLTYAKQALLRDGEEF